MATQRIKVLCEDCQIFIWPQNKSIHSETMKHRYNKYANHDRFLIDGKQVDIDRYKDVSIQTDTLDEPKHIHNKYMFDPQ